MHSPFAKLLSFKAGKETTKRIRDVKEQKKTKEKNTKKPPSAKSLAAALPSVVIKPSGRKSVPKRSIPTTIVSPSQKNDKRKTSRKLSSAFDVFGSDDDELEDAETADLVVVNRNIKFEVHVSLTKVNLSIAFQETPNELPELSPEEEELFEAVEAAQLVEVKKILMEMDVNTVSQLSSKWNVEVQVVPVSVESYFVYSE